LDIQERREHTLPLMVPLTLMLASLLPLVVVEDDNLILVSSGVYLEANLVHMSTTAPGF
jgi:hypothetical protein